MAVIIEEAETLKLGRVATVRTARGDQYVIDTDAALRALADLFSDFDNEKRFGWNLARGWYESEFQNLRAVLVKGD